MPLRLADYDSDLDQILASNPDRALLKKVLIELADLALAESIRVERMTEEVDAEYSDVRMAKVCYLLRKIGDWEGIDDVLVKYVNIKTPDLSDVISMLADAGSENAHQAIKQACDLAVQDLSALLEVIKSGKEPEEHEYEYYARLMSIAEGLSATTNEKAIGLGKELRDRVANLVSEFWWGSELLKLYDSVLNRRN